MVESRPEFITEQNLKGTDKLEIAIGLESSNEEILKKCVRKGFTVADYTKAAEVMRGLDIPLRTYLLLKPPFMSERRAVEDAISSMAYASKFSESISINPVNVQKDTFVEMLWARGDYRPPWLWSLLEVLREGSKVSECRVFSSPSGGGTPRGVHNCEKCDKKDLGGGTRFRLCSEVGEI